MGQTFPSDGTCASVVGEREEGAGTAVAAGAVVAGVGGHGDLAEAGGVADGTRALEGGLAAAGGHDDVASAAVLALLASRRARVLELAELAHELRRATGKTKRQISKQLEIILHAKH